MQNLKFSVQVDLDFYLICTVHTSNIQITNGLFFMNVLVTHQFRVKKKNYPSAIKLIHMIILDEKEIRRENLHI